MMTEHEQSLMTNFDIERTREIDESKLEFAILYALTRSRELTFKKADRDFLSARDFSKFWFDKIGIKNIGLQTYIMVAAHHTFGRLEEKNLVEGANSIDKTSPGGDYQMYRITEEGENYLDNFRNDLLERELGSFI